MNFDEWLISRLEGEGLQGTVFYDVDEDSWQLNQNMFDIGLSCLFDQYDGKKIKIFVEVLD